MLALWRPAPPEPQFPTTAQWAAGLGRLRAAFDGGVGPFPGDLVALAEALFAELLADSAEPVLLHGDLHHDNILAAQRTPWLAIDPQGVIGEPAYEVGAWLRNPLPWLWQSAAPTDLLRRRLHILAAELGIDWARLAAWGLAQAVLSAWWDYEDHNPDWRGQLHLAHWLRTLLP
jgi:streptomycin 6-kinase